MLTHGGLLDANFQMANEKGEIVFEMKKKEPLDPDGNKQLYYIFRVHEKNMNEKQRKGFPKVLTMIMWAAKRMGIPMYTYDEITERTSEQVAKLFETDTFPEPGEGQIDVNIEVFNYATKELATLTIGISSLRKPDEVNPKNGRTTGD